MTEKTDFGETKRYSAIIVFVLIASIIGVPALMLTVYLIIEIIETLQ